MLCFKFHAKEQGEINFLECASDIDKLLASEKIEKNDYISMTI